jgi:hypothetical protein
MTSLSECPLGRSGSGFGIWKSSCVAAGPAIVICSVFTLIFIDKPFTVDDPTFLLMARHMLSDPLHPTAFNFVFHGAWLRLSQTPAGPLMPVLLMPSILAGGAEWLAHLAMLPVFILGLISVSALALRLGSTVSEAGWASLLTGTSAAVLACATTSMPDVPAMSFAALAAERLVAFRDQHRAYAAVSAVAAMSLAILARVHVVGLFVYLLPLLIGSWPRDVRDFIGLVSNRTFLVNLMPLAGAALAVFAVIWLTRDPETSGNIAHGVTNFSRLRDAKGNSASFFMLLVLSFPLGIGWIALYWRRILFSRWCWIAATGGVALAYVRRIIVSPASGWWPFCWEAPLTALGAAVLADIGLSAIRRRDRIDLALAGWLFLAAPVALYPQLVSKHILPSVPAMALLLVRHMRSERLSRSRAIQLTLCGGGILLGYLISSADDSFARIGQFAARVAAGEKLRGAHVWYDGGLGFAWYARKAGAVPLSDRAPEPRANDVVVAVAGIQPLQIERTPDAVMVRRISFTAPGGRVWGHFAGFWYNRERYGILPWQWSTRQWARVEVWRISYRKRAGASAVNQARTARSGRIQGCSEPGSDCNRPSQYLVSARHDSRSCDASVKRRIEVRRTSG